MLRAVTDPSSPPGCPTLLVEKGFRHDPMMILETSYELPRSAFPAQSAQVSAKAESAFELRISEFREEIFFNIDVGWFEGGI